ncbi:DUF485 domain-containing protein [Pseudomonas sp. BN415]|jgi:uncharacterized membrane protein (DUF485 family)|uniref:DUF485 domain-containing protein n=1 Tax=Pseudomonas sp. BN415 TaxID=2567889 RepID=UPI002456D8F7|nr:DUF485 domain-containing protein [Pseudomonas sp. BN415]MDH4582819.1 DUF485 domain-containing protein [Pseudomonas sp. BN415]
MPDPHAEHYRRIRQNPKFIELTRTRSRTSWLLSALVLAGYFLFMGVAAMRPELLQQPLYPGSHLSMGIPLGTLLLLTTWLLTGWYVHRANKHFDRLGDSIITESQV